VSAPRQDAEGRPRSIFNVAQFCLCSEDDHQAIVRALLDAGELELAERARKLLGLPLETEQVPPWWAR
jgi:hypothetical protein